MQTLDLCPNKSLYKCIYNAQMYQRLRHGERAWSLTQKSERKGLHCWAATYLLCWQGSDCTKRVGKYAWNIRWVWLNRAECNFFLAIITSGLKNRKAKSFPILFMSVGCYRDDKSPSIIGWIIVSVLSVQENILYYSLSGWVQQFPCVNKTESHEPLIWFLYMTARRAKSHLEGSMTLTYSTNRWGQVIT